MQYDEDMVDDVILALLFLGFFPDGRTIRALKGFDWACMNRLHDKGFIGNPKSSAKAVVVTEEGQEKAEELFSHYFGMSLESSDPIDE